MDESHYNCIKNLMLTYNTPEFSHKQIIVLYLKFKLLLVLSIMDYCFLYFTSNELYNFQCYDMV